MDRRAFLGGSLVAAGVLGSPGRALASVEPISRTGSMPWVDVTDFGADPTGTTDSTAAINNALNSLLTLGGVCLVPHGTYLVSAPLIVPAGVRIVGVGFMGADNTVNNGLTRGSILKVTAPVPEVLAFTGGNGSTTQAEFSGAENLSIDGQGKATIGILAWNFHRVRIGPLHMRNIGGTGIRIGRSGGTQTSYRLVLDEVHILGATVGIDNVGTKAPVLNMEFRGLEIRYTSGDAIKMGPPGFSGEIIGGYIAGCQRALNLTGCQKVLVAGLDIENCGGNGGEDVLIQSASYAVTMLGCNTSWSANSPGRARSIHFGPGARGGGIVGCQIGSSLNDDINFTAVQLDNQATDMLVGGMFFGLQGPQHTTVTGPGTLDASNLLRVNGKVMSPQQWVYDSDNSLIGGCLTGDAYSRLSVNTSGVRMGPGTVAADVRLARTGSKTLLVDDGAGGAAGVQATGILRANSLLGTTRPSGCAAGAQWWDPTLHQPIWWTGSQWVNGVGAPV